MKVKFIIAAVAMAAIVSSCADCNKTSLFNGKDLNGWVCVVDSASDVSASEVFSVRDGNIRIEGEPFGYMRTHKKYGDYQLHVEWRWVGGEGTNSGIFQRVQNGDKVWPAAVECQLKAGRAGDFVMLGGAKIAEVECVGEVPVKERVGGECEKAVGEWNEADITCVGGKITVYINGELQNEGTAEYKNGFIALQSEGGPIEFRNIYLTSVE